MARAICATEKAKASPRLRRGGLAYSVFNWPRLACRLAQVKGELATVDKANTLTDSLARVNYHAECEAAGKEQNSRVFLPRLLEQRPLPHHLSAGGNRSAELQTPAPFAQARASLPCCRRLCSAFACACVQYLCLQ